MVDTPSCLQQKVTDDFLVSLDLLQLNMYLTVGDQTLFRHLLVELSISNTAYHVNVIEHVEQVSNWCFTPSQPVRLYQGDIHLILYI